MTTNFSVANEAELNAAIAAINLGGTSSAINTSYTITITSDFTLTADITPINLASGDNLTVTGSSIYNTTAVLDGNGSTVASSSTAGRSPFQTCRWSP